MSDIQTRERVAWIDCCRGVCIVLVVYGHVAGGLEAAGILKVSSVFVGFREWIYQFHMPAFFFLSGLFARRACEQPFIQFLQGRLKTLVYPYILWTAIILASQIAMARFVNNLPDLPKALRFLYEPYGYGLWFLYSLFLISLLFQGFGRLRIAVIPTLLTGMAVYVLSMHNVFGFWSILNTSMGYAFFYVVGGCYPGIISAPFRNARLPVLAVAGAGLFAVITLLQAVQFDPAGLLKLVRALLGVSGAVCVAMALARTVTASLWAFLGVYSLEIYLAHPLWGTASRAMLLRCGIHAPAIFVVCGVFLGVVGSLAMAVVCKHFEFPYLYRWPAKKTGVGTSKQAVLERSSTQIVQ